MTSDFLNFLNGLAWGFVAGYLWQPFWSLGRKIVEEIKLAKKEWRKS